MKKVKAFSLIELLVVLGIIGVILTIAIPRIMKSREIANEIACKSELESIQASLELYYTKYFSYPGKLKILIDNKFISKSALTDPWGNNYYYKPIFKSKKYIDYNLFSFGNDGIQGTKDDIKPEK